MIPASSGAAAAIVWYCPHLNGKLDGYAIRVPTINVCRPICPSSRRRATTVEEINNAARQASETDLKGILEYNKEPLVSIDFNHNPASSIFDATLTKGPRARWMIVVLLVRQRMGLSNRMLDATVALMNAR